MTFAEYSLGTTMDLVNTGIEVKESEVNIKNLKNKIKGTKLKLVLSTGGAGLSVVMNEVSNFVLYRKATTIGEIVLCAACIGASVVGACVFYKNMTNSINDLGQLQKAKTSEEKTLGEKHIEHEDACINARIVDVINIVSEATSKTI